MVIFFIRSRGTDLATTKILEQKIVGENFWMKPNPEEMILEP
jgi:hypothetical protein